MYFTVQRVITFLVGLFIFGGSALYIFGESVGAIDFIAVFALCLIGIYILIASLIPYKTATKEISNEIVGEVLIQIPRKLLEKIWDIF